MTPHLEAVAGDYAETVLLPGDPDRAVWISRTLLEAPRCVNRIRGALDQWSGALSASPRRQVTRR